MKGTFTMKNRERFGDSEQTLPKWTAPSDFGEI
jgi:hypothetical protein